MFAFSETLRELPTAQAVMAGAEQLETSQVAQHFIARKKEIERQGLENPRLTEIVALDNGSEIKVTSSVVDLMEINKPLEKLQSQPKQKLKIAVFHPGLFEATSTLGLGEGHGNTGNTEIKLAASGLFASQEGFIADAIIFIKPEGLNAKAYENGQETVGLVSAEKLKELIIEFKQKHKLPKDIEVEFDLTGFSEGSNQVLSTAAKIMEQKLGSIRRVFSIGGAGFVGSKEVSQANPIAFVLKTILSAGSAQADGYRTQENFDFTIGKERIKKIGSKLQQVLKGELLEFDSEKTKTADRINILRFFWRLGITRLKLDKIGESVPWQRLQAASSLNADRLKLVEAGIPILVFADTSDPFFSPTIVEEEINAIRRAFPGAKIQLVVASLGHSGPHHQQTSFSVLMEDLSRVLDEDTDSERKLSGLAKS